jgi:hypothetical protein
LSERVRRFDPTATLREHWPAASPDFPWRVVDENPEEVRRPRISLRLSAVSLQSEASCSEEFLRETPWRSRISPRMTCSTGRSAFSASKRRVKVRAAAGRGSKVIRTFPTVVAFGSKLAVVGSKENHARRGSWLREGRTLEEIWARLQKPVPVSKSRATVASLCTDRSASRRAPVAPATRFWSGVVVSGLAASAGAESASKQAENPREKAPRWARRGEAVRGRSCFVDFIFNSPWSR